MILPRADTKIAERRASMCYAKPPALASVVDNQ